MQHYYAIFDFECTCWEERRLDGSLVHSHEIIEFPVVFLNSETLNVDFEFHAYVRPVENPVLTEFCTKLTGITQTVVDEADTLPSVIAQFDHFLSENSISKFTPCTDGPWDFTEFLVKEANRKNINYPKWATKWLDIRRRFEADFKLEKWVGILEMLKILNLEFSGSPHSGIDDARNIARIVATCHRKLPDKGRLRPNRFIR